MKGAVRRLALHYVSRTKQVKFVQIGVHDGIDLLGNLFISRYCWQGVMVEPIIELLDQVKLKYLFEYISFENVCITDKDGTTTLNIDHDSTARSSVDIVNPIFRLDKLEKRKVKTMTLETLFKKHDITDLDVFFIDTEGYDYNIMMQLLKTNIRPKLIHFEHHYARMCEYNYLKQLLKKEYYVLGIGKDTMCIRR